MKCSDPETFRLTGEWKGAGTPSSEEVRHEVLWRFVRGDLESGATAVRGHLSECAECRQLADSFRRLNGALQNRNARVFAVCPSPATLAGYLDGELPEDERERVHIHLEQCEACRQEVAWLQKPATAEVAISRRGWIKWVGAAAAMLVTAPFVWWKSQPSSPYAHLAEVPPLEHDSLLRVASGDAQSLLLFRAAADAYDRGDFREASGKADQIIGANPRHSSAIFVKGMAEYRMGRLIEAYRLIQLSESIRPKSDYRCWVALQFALLTGDIVGIRKECQHVDGHERYRDRARRIMTEVQRIAQT
jgi:tetratricopeptide (TPR) repeat protein